MHRTLFYLALFFLAWPLAACASPTPPASHVADDGHPHGAGVDLPHIHGMGYSADGATLVVAAHDGLRIYEGDRWLEPDLPAHDYMGYSPTSKGFFSSGHPAPGATLPNPLGLVRSDDGGASLQTLGFAGVSDFH